MLVVVAYLTFLMTSPRFILAKKAPEPKKVVP